MLEERKVTIHITEDQKYWILRMLNSEFDKEESYRSSSDCDTEYLEQITELYDAVQGKGTLFQGMSNASDIADKKARIQKLKDLQGERQ